MTKLGFYGKVASRGDFVSRGLPESFIRPWDAWLAAGLHTSRQQLGDDWLSAYLISPLWRFALASGVCGVDAVVGVSMPSVDRVGRYFPLTVAQLIEPEQSLAALVSGPEDWFEHVEALLLATLEEDADFTQFEGAVAALDCLPTTSTQPVHQVANLQHSGAADPRSRQQMLADLACDGVSLWWGKGSEHIAPGLMRCSGLPDVASFSCLLGQGGSI